VDLYRSQQKGRRLMLMRGEGRVLAWLGGGKPQRQGLEALADWFREIDPS
jgi:hypothetical protein